MHRLGEMSCLLWKIASPRAYSGLNQSLGYAAKGKDGQGATLIFHLFKKNVPLYPGRMLPFPAIDVAAINTKGIVLTETLNILKLITLLYKSVLLTAQIYEENNSCPKWSQNFKDSPGDWLQYSPPIVKQVGHRDLIQTSTVSCTPVSEQEKALVCSARI